MIRSRTSIVGLQQTAAVAAEFRELTRAVRFKRVTSLPEEIYLAAAVEAERRGLDREVVALDGWSMRCRSNQYAMMLHNQFVIYWGFDVENTTLIARPTWGGMTGFTENAPPLPVSEMEIGKFTQPLTILPQPNWKWVLNKRPREGVAFHMDVLAFQNEAEHAVSEYDAKLRKALE